MSELETLKTELKLLNDEHGKILTELDNIVKKKDPIIKKIGKIERSRFEWTLENVMNLDPHNDWGMEFYYDCQKFFRDNFKYISSSGYFVETNQNVIRLCIYKNSNLSLVEKEILLVLPFIKPINDNKVISIFEHTLSEFGSYSLIINDEYHIQKTTYGREEIIFTSESLIKVLVEIARKHYYEKQEPKEKIC